MQCHGFSDGLRHVCFTKEQKQTTNNKQQRTDNRQQTTDNRRQTTNTTHNTHTHHTPHWGSCGPKPTSKMPVSRVYSATVGSQPAVLSASSQNTRTHTHMRPDCSAYAEEPLRNQDQTHNRPRTKQQQQQQLLNCRARSLLTT